MLKQITAILVVSFFILACTGVERPKKPDNLLSKNKMANFIYDLYIINAAKSVNKSLLDKNNFVPDAYMLEKHKIDSAQFAVSNTYYAFDPDTYKDIIEAVKVKIENEKTTFEAILEKEEEIEKKTKDSLRLIKSKEKELILKSTKDSISK